MDELSVDEQRRRARIQPGRLTVVDHRDPERIRVDGHMYELVGEDERVDRAWEHEEARRRREAWREQREQRLAELRAARAKLPLGVRLDQAIASVDPDGLPARRAQAVKRRSGSDIERIGPPLVGGHERELRECLALISHHVSMVERIGDEQRGLLTTDAIGDTPGNTGGLSAGRMMSTKERNRIVFEDFQGVRSDVVAREAPYLGTSARTIERARASEASARGLRVRPVDGTVLGPAQEGRAA